MKVKLQNGQMLESVVYVNPEETTFQRMYIIGTQCGFSAFLGLVVADSAEDAIDEWVGSDHGKRLRIDLEDRDDYIYITIDGEQMDAGDARKRYPALDIDKLIEDGWADGSTEDRGHHTGQGEYYDSDHLILMDGVQSIEMEPSDFEAMPNDDPDDVAEIGDTIREHFARSAFLCEWADAAEESGQSLSGMEISEIAPQETPAIYLEWANSSISTIEASIGISIVEGFRRACFVPAVASWENRADPEDHDDAETFGHYLGMQFVGHGVGWSDSHPDLPFSLPYGESPDFEITLDEEEE